MHYVPVNKLTAMSKLFSIFLGLTNTKQRSKCIA